MLFRKSKKSNWFFREKSCLKISKLQKAFAFYGYFMVELMGKAKKAIGFSKKMTFRNTLIIIIV